MRGKERSKIPLHFRRKGTNSYHIRTEETTPIVSTYWNKGKDWSPTVPGLSLIEGTYVYPIFSRSIPRFVLPPCKRLSREVRTGHRLFSKGIMNFFKSRNFVEPYFSFWLIFLSFLFCWTFGVRSLIPIPSVLSL